MSLVIEIEAEMSEPEEDDASYHPADDESDASDSTLTSGCCGSEACSLDYAGPHLDSKGIPIPVSPPKDATDGYEPVDARDFTLDGWELCCRQAEEERMDQSTPKLRKKSIVQPSTPIKAKKKIHFEQGTPKRKLSLNIDAVRVARAKKQTEKMKPRKGKASAPKEEKQKLVSQEIMLHGHTYLVLSGGPFICSVCKNNKPLIMKPCCVLYPTCIQCVKSVCSC